MVLLDEFVGLLDALLDRHPTAIERSILIQHPTPNKRVAMSNYLHRLWSVLILLPEYRGRFDSLSC